MTSILNFVVARESSSRLREAAERARAHAVDDSPISRVTLRYAAAADAERLRHLAELDSAEPAPTEALIAEIDGRIRAALPLDGSRPIADPFHRGAELIDLLRLRAAQLGRPLAA
jgi:hypothetical protein